MCLAAVVGEQLYILQDSNVVSTMDEGSIASGVVMPFALSESESEYLREEWSNKLQPAACRIGQCCFVMNEMIGKQRTSSYHGSLRLRYAVDERVVRVRIRFQYANSDYLHCWEQLIKNNINP